jgi:hypothetical protein
MLAHEKIGTVELALDQVLFRASLLQQIISVACWPHVLVHQALMFMQTSATKAFAYCSMDLDTNQFAHIYI